MRRMSLLLASSLVSIVIFEGTAASDTLTVCNMSSSDAGSIFFDPLIDGLTGDRRVDAGSCIALSGIPAGDYGVSLYMGFDCFLPVSVYGDTTYTFDQGMRDYCAQREAEYLEQMFGGSGN